MFGENLPIKKTGPVLNRSRPLDTLILQYTASLLYLIILLMLSSGCVAALPVSVAASAAAVLVTIIL
jgi:hypothetical protein